MQIAGLQRPVRHPVRHAPRGRGQAPGRADQGRHGHLRRSRPRGLRDERRAAREPIVSRVRIRRATTGSIFPTIVPEVAIIRATTADERGNLSYEHEGAYLGRSIRRSRCATMAASSSRRSSASPRTGTLQPHDVRRAGNPRRLHRRRAGPDADDADGLRARRFRARSSGRCRRFETPSSTSPKVIARRVAQELRDGDAGQYRLRHLGQCAAHPHRGGPARRGDLGHRTGRRRRRAAARLPVRLRLERRGDRASRRTSSPTSRAAGFDMSLLSFLQIDRFGSVNVSKLGVRPHVTAGAGGFVDITARAKKIVFSGYFTAGAKLDVRGRRGCRSRRKARSRSSCRRSSTISFSGPPRGRAGPGDRLRHRTLRPACSSREGVTVTELAPGVDLERDVLAQAEFPLRVANDLRAMDPALFRPEPIGLTLRPSAEARPVSPYVELAFDGPCARLTLRRADKLNALDRAMIDALFDAARAIEASPASAGRDPDRRGQGLLRRRRHRRLGRAAAARHVARLDARRPSRLRGAGAAARAPDRGPFGSRASAAALSWRRSPTSASPKPGSGLACRNRVSAWRPDGRARSGWCGASALRSCGAWRSAGTMFGAEEGLALGLVDEVTPKGEGLARADALAADDRRARAARRPDGQGDDQRRRRRGPGRADRGPGRRADRIHGRSGRRAWRRFAPSARLPSPADRSLS